MIPYTSFNIIKIDYKTKVTNMHILISSKQCNVYKIAILSLSIKKIKNIIQRIKLQQILLKVLENAKKKIYYY